MTKRPSIKLSPNISLSGFDVSQSDYWFILAFGELPSECIIHNVLRSSAADFLIGQGFRRMATREVINTSALEKARRADCYDDILNEKYMLSSNGDGETEIDKRCFYINENKKLVIQLKSPCFFAQSATKRDGVVVNNAYVCNLIISFCDGNRSADLLRDDILILFVVTNINYASKNKINFLCREGTYFSLKSVSFPDRIKIDLKCNYGKNFIEVNDKIVDFLNSDKTGLVILHGKPGTGKTFYIQHLLQHIDKRLVYVPAHLIGSLSDPEFLDFMLENRNLVLIIEDAEEAVTKRGDTDSHKTAVSNLLNLTDGILGKCIRVKTVCTFNTEIGNIDPALLRKGRLAAQHEFLPLSAEDANIVLRNLGIDKTVSEPMTLGDLYNIDNTNFNKEKESLVIGFSRPKT